MSVDKIIWIITAIALLGLLVAIIIITKRSENQYDERQLLARNAAFKTAYVTLVLYCVICGFLNAIDVVWAHFLVQMFLGIIISLTVFAVLCIKRDALYNLSEKKRRNHIIWFFAMGLIQLFNALISIGKGEPLWDRKELSAPAVNIICFVFFIVIGITSVVKLFSDRKSGDK